MKKSLLFSAALLLAASAFAGAPAIVKADAASFKAGPKVKEAAPKALTRAQETFDYTYAYEPYTALSLNNMKAGVSRVYMLFEIIPSDIKAFAGSKVTDFTVCSPTDENGRTNTVTEGSFFYSTDPGLSKLDYTQDFTMSTTPFSYNKVQIDSPYTITGEEDALFFGYSIVVPKPDNMFYVVVDGVPNVDEAGIFGVSVNGNTFPKSNEWQSFGSVYGSLCMSVTLERENFPMSVSFASVQPDICLPLGEVSAQPFTVVATAGVPIESFDIEYKLNGQTYSYSYGIDPPYPAGVSRYMGINVEFPALDEKIKEKVEFKLTKINGVENTGDGITAESNVIVVDEMPVHRTLYEEYTSTTCGWCTRGFAALEYMSKNYPEFVTASFHTRYSGADPMQVTSDFPTQVSGYPSAVLNRTTQIDPYFGTQRYDMPVPVVGDILALNAIPTIWNVKVSHSWASDDVLVAEAEVENMAGFENGSYKIAYLLVADGLTGSTRSWYQTNYYNTEKAQFVPELNAFCLGGEYGRGTVSGLVYNDVVISPEGIHGVAGSVPASMAQGEKATHSFSFDLTKISSNLTIDKNKLRVIAILLDKNGSVLNCAKDEVKYSPSAVEGIENMDNAPVEYYNLNGMKVAKPVDGIFIRRQGGKTEKVIIK